MNIRINESTSEKQSTQISFIDLVGFDDEFTNKIIQGSSFRIDESQIRQTFDDERL